MEFTEAEKVKTFLRLFISGSSGTGKTFSALKIAKGISGKTSGKIGVIDSEHNKSTLNADWVKFDVLNIAAPYKVEDYVEAIHLAASKGYSPLIIDSVSHAWNNVLSRINEIVELNKKENFRAWGKKGEGTDLQDHFIETLLSYPGHLICCCRAKMEYAMKSVNGLMKIVKMGVGNIQRNSIEYEFDIQMEATENAIEDHLFQVTKDRSGKYQTDIILPDEELGISLYEWLMSPDKEFIVEDFPEIKEIKKKITNGISYFDADEIDKLTKGVFGKEKWQVSRDAVKLSELLELMKVEFSKAKSK